MNFQPFLSLSLPLAQVLTDRRRLLNDDGELTPAKFELMMLNQVRGFSHRKVVAAMSRQDEDEQHKETIFALKIILSTAIICSLSKKNNLN